MSRSTIVTILFVVWAGAFAASFLTWALTAPTDMGFTRGLNRVTGFVAWQGGALVAAIMAMIAGAGVPREQKTTRLLARIPLLAELTLVAMIAAVIGWTLLHQTPATDMPPALEPTTPTQG